MTSAKAVGALGGSMGALGRSSSEVLRGIGDVAGLLGSGSLLAVGLTVTTAAVVKFYEAWGEYRENQKIAGQAIDAIGVNIRALTNEALQPGIEAARQLRAELASIGTTPTQAKREAQSALIDDLQARRERVSGAMAGRFGRSGDPVLERLTARAKELDAALVTARSTYDEIVASDLAITKRTEEYRLAAGGVGKAGAGKAGDAALSSWETRVALDKQDRERRIADSRREQAEILSIYEAREDARNEMMKERERAEKEAHEDALRRARELADDQKKAIDEQKASYASLGQSIESTFLVTGVGAVQGYIDAKLKGEQAAEQLALAGFMSSVGQQLVGIGTKAIFEGAIISANPLTPGLGAPMIGIGLGAIAAGVTMGAGGSAIAAAAAKPPGSGGGGVGTGERGFGRRSRQAAGGGSSDSGPLQIVNVYGVDGPQAEDQARRTVRDLRLADRRRLRR